MVTSINSTPVPQEMLPVFNTTPELVDIKKNVAADSTVIKILAFIGFVFVAVSLLSLMKKYFYPEQIKYEDLTSKVRLNASFDLASTVRDLKYLNEIKATLQESKKTSILLVGNPGSGKSTLLELLALQIEQDPEYSNFRNKKIYEMDIDALVGGSTYVGVREGRIKSFFDMIEKEKALLVIPDLNPLISSQSSELTPKVTVCDTILLPYLKRGAFICISKSTPSALVRRSELIDQFRRILIKPRKNEEIVEIVANRSKVDKIEAEKVFKYVKNYTPLRSNLKQYIQIYEIFKKTNNLNKAIKDVTSIPLPINQDDNDFLLNLEKILQERIFGQEEAIRLLSSACRNYLQAFTNPTRPIGVFLLVGPTGTGKTELSISLANILFKGNCIRLNMIDFQNRMYIDTIKKTLSENLLENPFSVVLLDEVDYTDSNTLAFFLTIFDAGYFTDSSGNTVDCRQALFLMTSNLQAQIIQKNNSQLPIQKAMETIARNHFTPQFIGRVDQIILFHPLASEHIRELITKELRKIQEQLNIYPHCLDFQWDINAIDYLEKNYDCEGGARSIQKALKVVFSKINILVLESDILKKFILSSNGQELVVKPYLAEINYETI